MADHMQLIIVHADQFYAESLQQIVKQCYPLADVYHYAGILLALKSLQDNPADLCLVDIRATTLDWFDFMDAIIEHRLAKRIIGLLALEGDYALDMLSRMRFDGVFDVEYGSIREFVDAICRVMRGESYYSPRFHRILCEGLQNREHLLSKFTATELLVLACIGSGQRNSEISKELSCSALTVQTHRQNIMRKFNIRRAIDLANFAQKIGLVQFSRGIMIRPGFEQRLSLRNRERKIHVHSDKDGYARPRKKSRN